MSTHIHYAVTPFYIMTLQCAKIVFRLLYLMWCMCQKLEELSLFCMC